MNPAGLAPGASMERLGSLNDPAIFRAQHNAGARDDFDSALRRQLGGDQRAPQSSRQAAEEFVAMALVQPILAQLRETNEAAEPFAPSDVEKRFGPMLDAEIAHRMVRSAGWGLVDAVERRLGGAPGATPEQGVTTDA